MKKFFFITFATVIICQLCFSEVTAKLKDTQQRNTVDELFKTISKEKNIKHIKIGGLIMTITRAFSDTKGVSGVEVFAFDECECQVKNKLNAAIKHLKDSAYETLVSSTQDGENTKILVKIKDDYINEIVIMKSGDDPTFVRVKGKIKLEDMQDVVKNNK